MFECYSQCLFSGLFLASSEIDDVFLWFRGQGLDEVVANAGVGTSDEDDTRHDWGFYVLRDEILSLRRISKYLI